jgi:trehalose 6-phosphate synthase
MDGLTMAKRDSKMVIVSARAPFVSGPSGLTRAPGGLVSAVLPLVRSARGAWIAAGTEKDASEASEPSFKVQAIKIDAETRAGWYGGASNGALWPLSHGFLEHCRFRSDDFRAYREVNEAVAKAAAESAPEGSTVWAHDYQLALVPALLRAMRPDLRIGFFWHIPWPAAELLRALPWAAELVEGMLGADLVGLHVPRYVRAFRDILGELGIPHAEEGDAIVARHGGRAARIGSFPIGIDIERWTQLANDPEMLAEAERLKAQLGGARLLVSVDRMDYSKGIVERLEAIERMLERHPETHGRVCFVQIGVPSRESVEAYRELRQRIESTVGRIQGRFGTLAWKPVHLFARSLDPRVLAPFYMAADAALVTPMRDGMNLVAFEYVAARAKPNGRLLLSSTAGAADILSEANLVNPYDEDGLVEAITSAVLSPETSEDSERMVALKNKVLGLRVDAWVDNFLTQLDESTSDPGLPMRVAGGAQPRSRIARGR